MATPTRALPTLVEIMLQAAERAGLSWRILDGELGYFFALSDGTRELAITGARSPLNLAGPQRQAELKYYAQLILAGAGFRVPGTARCLRRDVFAHVLGSDRDEQRARERAGVEAALEFAAQRGQVIVKPNSLSRGRRVRALSRLAEVEAAILDVFEVDDTALVQALVPGIDLRVDMVDGQLLVAYVRAPLRVVGDGQTTLHDLFVRCDARFADRRYQAKVTSSATWRAKVDAAGHALERVVPRGVVVDLGPVLNLNETATCAPLETLARPWLDYVARIGEAMRMRHFGVDLRVPGELDEVSPEDSTIIEVNGSPLIVQLYELGHRELAITAQAKVWAAAFAD